MSKYVDHNLVQFKDFDGFILVQDMQFQKEYFWVQLHNFPLAGMKKIVGEKWNLLLDILMRSVLILVRRVGVSMYSSFA